MSQVLEIYSRVRQPLATEVARRSRLNGEYYSFRTFSEEDHHDLSSSTRLQEIVKQIQENSERVTQTDWSVDLQRAMSLLQAELAT
jgi:hypothetical protein